MSRIYQERSVELATQRKERGLKWVTAVCWAEKKAANELDILKETLIILLQVACKHANNFNICQRIFHADRCLCSTQHLVLLCLYSHWLAVLGNSALHFPLPGKGTFPVREVKPLDLCTPWHWELPMLLVFIYDVQREWRLIEHQDRICGLDLVLVSQVKNWHSLPSPLGSNTVSKFSLCAFSMYSELIRVSVASQWCNTLNS